MQTAVCDSFVVLTHCILSFSQREKWVLYTLTAIQGAQTFAHESIVSIAVAWQPGDSWNTSRTALWTPFSVANQGFTRYFFLSYAIQGIQNIKVISIIMKTGARKSSEFTGASRTGNQMKHFFFLNISFQQLLESERLRLWLWLLLLKITAWHLLNQSVSVLHTQFPSTWRLSPTLAFCNVLSLRQIFTMGID